MRAPASEDLLCHSILQTSLAALREIPGLIRATERKFFAFSKLPGGFPKGALLHHRGITNNARFTAQRMEVAEGDVWINPMPLFHTGGCVLGVLGPMAVHVSKRGFRRSCGDASTSATASRMSAAPLSPSPPKMSPMP